MKEKFKKEVEKRFEDLKEYTSTFNQKVVKEKKELIDSNKELFMNKPDLVDIRSISKTFLFINGLHQIDIRELQTKFIEAYILFKKLNEEDFKFSEEIEISATIIKNSNLGQAYIVKNGEFIEIDKERIENLLNNYEDKKFFKLYEDQIKTLLNTKD